MAITYSLDRSEFVKLFDEYDRSENFSIAARECLYDYYDDLSYDLSEDIQIDPIAICCDWCEYDADDLWSDYNHILDSNAEKYSDETMEILVEKLEQETTVLKVDGINTYLILVF